jgi:hypothetical protein
LESARKACDSLGGERGPCSEDSGVAVERSSVWNGGGDACCAWFCGVAENEQAWDTAERMMDGLIGEAVERTIECSSRLRAFECLPRAALHLAAIS